MKRINQRQILTVVSVCILGVLVAASLTARATPSKSSNRFELDLKQLLAATGTQKWTVLTDQKYSSNPRSLTQLTVGDSRLSGRRIVAMCRASVEKQGQITDAFDKEIERQLRSSGAIQKGEEGANHTGQTVVKGVTESTDISAPRRFFAIGNSYGVLDAYSFAHEGHIVLTISYMQ